MKDTIIYLIRHAKTINENGIRNTDETPQDINEKEILSIKGEQDSKKLSENDELKNIDIIWSSSCVFYNILFGKKTSQLVLVRTLYFCVGMVDRDNGNGYSTVENSRP